MMEDDIKCVNCKEEFDDNEIERIEMPNKVFNLCITCAIQMEGVMEDALCEGGEND